MDVNYIGPIGMDAHHPATRGCDFSGFPGSCYLVEVSAEAGIAGPIIEGDLLIVDEQRSPHHDDLIIANVGKRAQLHRIVRMADRLWAIPLVGARSSFQLTQDAFRGVVVCQHRRYTYI